MKNRLHFDTTLGEKANLAFSALKKEKETIGYYALPDQDTSTVLAYCETIPSSIESIAVIGIGGSSLGAKAIYEFLKPVENLSRKLYFFESTDPINIKSLLSDIDLNKTHFLVISKSGTTVETFAIYSIFSHFNPRHHVILLLQIQVLL